LTGPASPGSWARTYRPCPAGRKSGRHGRLHGTSSGVSYRRPFYDGPADREVRQAWVDDFAAALHQGDTGAYVGFVGDEGQARVRDAYPGSTWDRLAAIKARWDPTNLFRLNQNIPPAIQGPGRPGPQPSAAKEPHA
jgi:Berberine and berberine like